jgi:hypothetical protein
MKTRDPTGDGEPRVSICEVYLEVMVLLLAAATAAVGMWALPIWGLVALYVGAVVGGFVATVIVATLQNHRVPRAKPTSRRLFHRAGGG